MAGLLPADGCPRKFVPPWWLAVRRLEPAVLPAAPLRRAVRRATAADALKLRSDIAACRRPNLRHTRERPTMWTLLKEFLEYLRREQKWWLIPVVVILVLVGALLVFGATSGLGWAIYPFM